MLAKEYPNETNGARDALLSGFPLMTPDEQCCAMPHLCNLVEDNLLPKLMALLADPKVPNSTLTFQSDQDFIRPQVRALLLGGSSSPDLIISPFGDSLR